MTIAEHIGDRPVLLVLDNCEHLAAAVADLADRLLRACASLSILTTSRELLGVDGEHSGRSRRYHCPATIRRRGRPHWPSLTRSGCSSSAPSWSCPRSGSPTTTPSRYCRSAGGWTGCRWRSSWPRPRCGSCRPPCSPNAWTTSSPSWSAALRGAAGPLAGHQRPRGSRGAGAHPRQRRDGRPAARGGTGAARADRDRDPAVREPPARPDAGRCAGRARRRQVRGRLAAGHAGPARRPGAGTARCRRRRRGPGIRLGCRCGTHARPSGFRPRPGGSAVGRSRP